MDGLELSFVRKMKFDPGLRLSDENFAQKLKDGTRMEQRSKEKRLDSVIGYPTPLDFALFACAAYQDRGETETHSDYEKRLQLPKGWKLLTTATGLASMDSVYGYFGAAYWQPARRRVVIAHRGTVAAFEGTKLKNLDAVRADLMAIVGHKYVKQMDAACTFAFRVREAVEDVERDRKTTFEIFLTGHSLGAWLAQVTTFSLKYLTLVKGAFARNIVEGYHAHTVVFDSPGCEDTIRNMIIDFDVRYAGKSMDGTSLDITSYLSSPNFVNCCNTHVGKLFRVYPKITSKDYVSYTKSSHSMDAILQTFQTSLPKIKEIVDWPRIEIDLWRCKIWEIRENILGKEYRDFFQFATDLNDYDPSAKEIRIDFKFTVATSDENKKRLVRVRYRTRSARTNECACNVFTDSELEFMKLFQYLRIRRDSFFEGEPMPEEYRYKIAEKLNNLIINVVDKTIRSGEEDKLKILQIIPYVKTLLRLYSRLKKRALRALTDTETYLSKMEYLTSVLLPSDWPDFGHFLASESSICQVSAECGTDSAMAKVLTVIEEKDFTVLAFELQNLILIETYFHLTEFLKSDSWRDVLIVIECKAGTFKNGENFLLVKKLQQEVRNKEVNAKLVLITDIMDKFNPEDNSVRFRHGGIAWRELTNQAQTEIMSKNVIIFQGNPEKICLQRLVSQPSNLDEFAELLDPETLMKFIKGEEVFVGPKLISLVDFYIPRKFKYNPYVKEEIFDNATDDDVVAVWASEYDSFSMAKSEDGWKKRSNIRIITSDEDFEELLEKSPEKNIHCLRWKSNSLAWHKTKGSLNLIRRNIRDSESETIWENLEDVAGKTLVISDAPGMGKSTLLTVLAQKFKERNPNNWVIRINLNDCAQVFYHALKNCTKLNDLSDVAEFLSGPILASSENTKLRSEFERKLFKKSLTSSGRIVLILDAFDEISPDYEMIVLRLVKILNESRLEKLVLSTRPHTKDQLEDELSVLSYTMTPFSRDEKKTFLKRFWKRRLNDQRNLDKLADQSVDQLEKSIGAENGDFLGNPLQCQMLAEYYLDRIKVGEKIISLMLSLMELFECFVQWKMDIYYMEKYSKMEGKVLTRIDRLLTLLLIRKLHRQYALQLLLSREKWNELEYPEIEEVEGRELLETAVWKVGLVLKTGDNPQFIHRTFAEFFVFDYILYLARRQTKSSSRKLSILSREILLQPEFVATRAFLNGLIRYEKYKDETTTILRSFAKSVAQNWTDNETKCLSGLGYAVLHELSREQNLFLLHTLLETLTDECGPKIVKSLIETPGRNSLFALHIASENGHPELTRLLLENEANINACTDEGKTPLYFASENGHLDIVSLLLENGADVNASTREGTTPLYVASENGHLDITRLLLENGAHINACTDEGKTPLYVASKNGHLDIVRLLLENGAHINACTDEGKTPLYVASENGHLVIVRLLLENGAHINAFTDEGKTPLYVASENGHLDIVHFLLEKGADVIASTREGTTPLHAASENSRLEIARPRLVNEAHINASTREGTTPLYVASENSRQEIARPRLVNEAYINVYTDIVSLVLENGIPGMIVHSPLATEFQLRSLSISKFKGPNVKSKAIAGLAEERETELLKSIAGFKETYNRLETELRLANDRVDEMSKTTLNIEDSRIEEIHEVRERSLRLSMTKIELSALIEELENRVSESELEEKSKFAAEATVQKDVYKNDLIEVPMGFESPTKDREKEERGTEVSEFEGSMVECTNDGSEFDKVSREHIAGFKNIYKILEAELQLTNDRLGNASLESEGIHELRERSLQLSMTKIELTSLIAELEKRVSESESQN